METADADKIFGRLASFVDEFIAEGEGNKADNFLYKDPVDGSISANQGYRFMYPDGSRFVFRLSGTGSSGATVRIYLEKTAESVDMKTAEALEELSKKALAVSQVNEISGREGPTVIT